MKRIRVEEVILVSQNRKPGDLMRESEPEVEGKALEAQLRLDLSTAV